MRDFRYSFVLIAAITVCAAVLAACFASGPQKTIDRLISALQNKDSKAFLALIDVQALVANDIKSIIQQNEALSTMDSLGKLAGLDHMDELLGSFLVDRDKELNQSMAEGVSSGAIVEQCRTARDVICPWVPESLQNAEIQQVADSAAIVRVITPTGVISWLSLQERKGVWIVVGRSLDEVSAAAYAKDESKWSSPR